MKGFEAGLATGILLTTFLFICGVELLDFTTTFKESVDRAIELCRDGEWVKVDENTIYCKDGAEYKLGD